MPIRTKTRRAAAPCTAAINVAVIVFALTAFAGCGYSGGEALFMTGLFKRPTIDAGIKLNQGAVAVLVDDFQELCHWRETTTILAQEVAGEIKRKNVVSRLIPAARLSRLRQTRPDFGELSAREIGEQLDADRIITIDVREFFATVDPTEAHAAAHISVAVKVLNPREKKSRSKVRLWPKSPTGRIVQTELSAGQVTRAKTRRGILVALCHDLAEKIVKNFYDRKMEDFEKP